MEFLASFLMSLLKYSVGEFNIIMRCKRILIPLDTVKELDCPET